MATVNLREACYLSEPAVSSGALRPMKSLRCALNAVGGGRWGWLGLSPGPAIVFALFAAIGPPSFREWGNVETILRQTAIVGSAALGMTVVIIAGGIDLSVGSIVALCTVIVALVLAGGHGPLLAAMTGWGPDWLAGL